MPRVRPKVLIIAVGGTILATHTEAGILTPKPLSKSRIHKTLPHIDQTADLEILNLMVTDSVNFGPRQWQTISETLHKHLKSFDGIVIAHGMDTLAYTAAALSYMLRNLSIPVVLTGATTPLEFISSDARINLSHAIRVAAEADLAEVCVVINGQIFRGSRIKKIHEIEFDSVESPVGAIGHVQARIDFTTKIKKRASRKLTFEPGFVPNVAAILIHPGLTPETLEKLFETDPAGVVLLAYGKGGLPTAPERNLLPVVEKYVKSGRPLVITTQVLFGQCWMDEFDSSSEVLGVGTISAHDMTYEAAIVKLMWLLGQTTELKDISIRMQSNYAGEITPPIMQDAEDYFGP